METYKIQLKIKTLKFYSNSKYRISAIELRHLLTGLGEKMSEEEVRSFFMHWLDFFETYFLLVLLEIPFLFKCISWICLRSFFKHLLD